MGTLLVGVALELVATMLGTAGKQLVSHSARLPSRARARARRLKACGLLVTTALGPLADAMAYALAPQSLIAPMMGLDVVWNTLSAPFTLGEQLAWAHVVGTALVTSGATLTAVFGPHDHEEATLEVLRARFFRWVFLLYCAVMCVGLGLGMYVLRKHPKGSTGTARAVALGGLAGCIAGNMSFLSAALSAASTSIQSGDWSAWETPFPYALLLVAVVVAVSNIPFMSRALQEFEALFIVTIFEGCHITVACVSGDVVNQDMKHADWWRYCFYVAGLRPPRGACPRPKPRAVRPGAADALPVAGGLCCAGGGPPRGGPGTAASRSWRAGAFRRRPRGPSSARRARSIPGRCQPTPGSRWRSRSSPPSCPGTRCRRWSGRAPRGRSPPSARRAAPSATSCG
ncbi:unnamed protein product, partial [Prorocentrum cordatum]